MCNFKMLFISKKNIFSHIFIFSSSLIENLNYRINQHFLGSSLCSSFQPGNKSWMALAALISEIPIHFLWCYHHLSSTTSGGLGSAAAALPTRAGSVGGRRRAGSRLEPTKLLQKVRGEIKCAREIKAQSHFHILPIPLPKEGQCRIDHIKSHDQTHPLPHFLYVGILVLVNIWGPVVVTAQRRYAMELHDCTSSKRGSTQRRASFKFCWDTLTFQGMLLRMCPMPECGHALVAERQGELKPSAHTPAWPFQNTAYGLQIRSLRLSVPWTTPARGCL